MFVLVGCKADNSTYTGTLVCTKEYEDRSPSSARFEFKNGKLVNDPSGREELIEGTNNNAAKNNQNTYDYIVDYYQNSFRAYTCEKE